MVVIRERREKTYAGILGESVARIVVKLQEHGNVKLHARLLRSKIIHWMTSVERAGLYRRFVTRAVCADIGPLREGFARFCR